MMNVKNGTKYDFQNKLKYFILQIFILFRKSENPYKSLKTVKSSNLRAKSIKVRALTRAATN